MSIPTEHDEAINARILSVSEDLVEGFQPQPFHVIAEQSEVPLDTVLQRIRAMLEAGVIRRVRQTLLATKLAHGALVAWRVDEAKIKDATAAFERAHEEVKRLQEKKKEANDKLKSNAMPPMAG